MREKPKTPEVRLKVTDVSPKDKNTTNGTQGKRTPGTVSLFHLSGEGNFSKLEARGLFKFLKLSALEWKTLSWDSSPIKGTLLMCIYKPHKLKTNSPLFTQLCEAAFSGIYLGHPLGKVTPVDDDLSFLHWLKEVRKEQFDKYNKKGVDNSDK